MEGRLPKNSDTFLELRLSIGLQAVEKIQERIEEKSRPLRNKDSLHSLLKILGRYPRLKKIIKEFWFERINEEANKWIAHRDINMVMLATSLAPDGYLTL